MKSKLLFVTGLAVGYVLGARAGRKRYEQIAGAANKVWQSPGIQKQVHAAQDFAAEKVGDIPGAVFDGARKAATGAINVVQTKVTGKGPGGKAAKGTNGSAPQQPAPPETPPAFDEVQPKPDSEL